jgi:hypothetical protein
MEALQEAAEATIISEFESKYIYLTERIKVNTDSDKFGCYTRKACHNSAEGYASGTEYAEASAWLFKARRT